MKTRACAFIVLLIFAGVEILVAQTVTRGPYLQSPTDNSIIFRWRTDQPSDSRVIFGTDAGTLTQTETVSGTRTEHTVKITGLSPFTQYFYAIGTSTALLSGPDNLHHFRTNVVPGTVQPIRIWAIGDMGKANTGQNVVRDSYLNYIGNNHTDVWLWMGDNAYNDGTDQEYQDKVFNIYPDIFKNLPFWPTPGNHDYNSICAIPCNKNPANNHSGPYLDIVEVPTNGEAGGVPSGTELYYSFDYGNVHFVSLNSELGAPLNPGYDWIGTTSSSNANNSPMMQWLKADLAANTKDWVIVFWHQCPYSKGSHDSDNTWELYMRAMRRNWVPVLEEYGVDMVMTGHSHVYERSYLINGFYGDNSSGFTTSNKIDGSSGNFDLGEPYMRPVAGPDSGKGTVYVVVGNSGSSTSSPSLNHPAMASSHGCGNCYGSFIIEVNGKRLDGKYLASDGSIMDEFTIIKQEPTAINNPASPLKEINIFPNPFDRTTNIEYTLDKISDISIALYDFSGKLIAQLESEKKKKAGTYTKVLDADALSLSKNVYLVKVKLNGQETVQRIVKLN